MKWFDKLKQAMMPVNQTHQLLCDLNESVSPVGNAWPQPETPRPGPGEKTEASVDTESGSVSMLYPREREVFFYLLDGVKMKDIAGELHIKTSTVNGYCGEIYRKLGVGSKAQLIIQYSGYRKNPGRRGDE